MLVLGGAGFLGSHLTESLLQPGPAVRVLDRANADLRNIRGLKGDLVFHGGDFANANDLEDALRGVSQIYHLVSTTIPSSSNENPVYDVETNLVPTVRLLDLACKSGARRVVFLSSGGTVYGKPNTLPIPEDHPTRPMVSYGVVKVAIENYLRLFHHLHGLEYAILRLSNPYGPRQDPAGAQGAAAVFLGRALKNERISIWGDGSVVRDYIHVKDAVAGILAAGLATTPAQTLNIGSGQGTSLNELVQAIRTASGRELPVDYTPGRPFDVPANVLDIARAKASLGWEPKIPLAQGLKETWDWLESRRV